MTNSPYSVAAIANYFILRGAGENVPISQLKLQKLLFFAQGWFLANYGRRLFDEDIEAWKYGPVIDRLYKILSQYGSANITQPIAIPDFNEGAWGFITPSIPESDTFTLNFLNDFWDAYGHLHAYQLANMTHEPNTPWYEVSMQYGFNPPPGLTIPDILIQKYFSTWMSQPQKQQGAYA